MATKHKDSLYCYTIQCYSKVTTKTDSYTDIKAAEVKVTSAKVIWR